MSEQTHMSLSYSGRNRNGASTYGVPGAELDTAAKVAKWLFDKRFQSAEIKDDSNRVVGGVTTDENGARVWWGEG